MRGGKGGAGSWYSDPEKVSVAFPKSLESILASSVWSSDRHNFRMLFLYELWQLFEKKKSTGDYISIVSPELP